MKIVQSKTSLYQVIKKRELFENDAFEKLVRTFCDLVTPFVYQYSELIDFFDLVLFVVMVVI